MPTIERWSLNKAEMPYRAPEHIPYVLIGHNGVNNVQTSPVSQVIGEAVRTHSGSIYSLGEPDAEFLRWRESIGLPTDREALLKSVAIGCDFNRKLEAL